MTEAQGFIVDPDDSTKAIVTPSGNMAGTVWIAPAGTSPFDAEAWRHIGFALDPQPFTPDPRYTLRQTHYGTDDAQEAEPGDD